MNGGGAARASGRAWNVMTLFALALAFAMDAGLPTTVVEPGGTEALLLLLAVATVAEVEERMVFEPDVDVEMDDVGGDVENGATTAGPRSRLARS